MCDKEIAIQLGPDIYKTNFSPFLKSSRAEHFTKKNTKENTAIWVFTPYATKLREITDLIYLGQFV